MQYVHRSMHICTPYIKEHSIHISPPNSNFALNIYTYVSSSKLTLPLSTQNAMTSNDMPCHVSLLCTYPPPPTLLSFPLITLYLPILHQTHWFMRSLPSTLHSNANISFANSSLSQIPPLFTLLLWQKRIAPWSKVTKSFSCANSCASFTTPWTIG